jgi:glycosyltransferase involved in cell wall biosynthesis
VNVLNLAPFNVWDLGYGKGRASTYLPLKGLADAGHGVWWLTHLDEVAPGDDGRLREDGIEVARFRLPVQGSKRPGLAIPASKLHSVSFTIGSFRAAYGLARRSRPDLIYAHQLLSAFPAFLLAQALRMPYAVKAYGFFPEIFQSTLYWGKLALRLPASLYVLTNDGTSAERIAIAHGAPPGKIAFLVNGIDKDLPAKADLSLKARLAPRGEKIVLAAFRLVAWKRVDLLVRAIPQVVEENPSVVFVIVGEGPEKESLITLCASLGVSRWVRFEGAVPNEQIPSYMCAADIFTSLNETSNLGNPLLEAMCCGKAVIAADTGTTSDVVKHGLSGILLEDSALDRLPMEILRLLGDDSLRDSLGQSARQFILHNWPTWDERVAQEVQLLENVVNSHEQAKARRQEPGS